MSYNGSGTFVINSTGQPVVANTVISATVFNALTADLATGLSTAITKDGQTTITANIPFGSNKITALGAGTAATDAANLSQVQTTAAKLINVTGTDTITGTMTPQLTSYAAGQLFYFVAAGANTGAVTINIDGLGAKSITRDGSTALANGDINSGEVVVLVYDGTRFQMINAANSFGNTTINGTLTVTGNTGLQANVSITSALSVGGTFNVTGAAALGSTLSVTGKSDLPTVSTASMNAAVALITTGTVTNLTSTSASVASINAAVALITTGTITALTATGASVASANVGTAVVTGLTVTGASIASVNVGAAVLSGNLTLNGGTANGVLYLNGSKVATSGSALTFDGTNLGIGTASPGQKLTVNGNAVLLANGEMRFADSANLQVGTIRNSGGSSVSQLEFLTSSTERMRIDSSGNVGIGLTPTASVGNLQVNGGAFATSTMYVGAAGSTEFSGGIQNLSNTSRSISLEADPTNAGANTVMYFNLDGSTRMAIDSSGNVGIGGTAAAFVKTNIAGTLPSSSNISIGFSQDATIPSATTSLYVAYNSAATTQAASFTLSNYSHYRANQPTFGAGSSVTSQYGFIVENSLTGATNNYGFYSDIASGSNRWNFYAAGTAANYFAGNTGIGRTPTAGYRLDIAAGTAEVLIESTTGTNRVDANLINTSGTFAIGIDSSTGGVYGTAYARAIFATGAYPVVIFTNSTERMRITSAGNIVAGASAALATNATDGFLYVPTCAGTPTGTPTAITGMAPIVVDTTNNKLYFYSGGQWRDAGP